MKAAKSASRRRITTSATRRMAPDGAPARARRPTAERSEHGVTSYRIFRHDEPFPMRLGGVLPAFQLGYETWGELSSARDNAILLQTGLSPGSHARSHAGAPTPGWWEEFIGPGLALDTNRFFVICSNVLGGCYGSTGPSSLDPRTGGPYALSFPTLTIEDMVAAQHHLIGHLGVTRL